MSSQRPNVDSSSPPAAVALRDALKYWLKLGFVSFGGPAGQIAMMHHELVEQRRWISEKRFLHALNYCMVLPGPEAQQLATYIGWLMHGTVGGIAAGALFVLPSLILLVVLSWLYFTFGDAAALQGVLYGIKPAVTAIVLFAAYRIGARALKTRASWAIAGAAFLALFVFHVPFPVVILGAAAVGFSIGVYSPSWLHADSAHQPRDATHLAAIIDDDTPRPAHARYRPSRTAAVAAIGVALWLGVYALIAMLTVEHDALTEMGWFFTKAALLTFGGAYAVLPYVYQGAVEQFAWLTAPQMIDGLALGETTPGPLIMIVAFVGYIGAATKQVFGPDLLALAGTIGACVATFFTFLPSFLFILIGAPLVEATRHEIRYTAPLTAITAAVVGVIVNLALFFAYHVLWPRGIDNAFEWFSAALGIAAFLALWRYKIGVIPVIGTCATLGAIYSLL